VRDCILTEKHNITQK